MRPSSRVLLTLLALAALLAGVGAPTSASPARADADTSDFAFSLFDADYTLSRAADGTSELTVVETLVAEFPEYDQNRGIIRSLPRFSQRVDLAPDVLSIVDEDGDAVAWEETVTDDDLELALGTDEFVHGETTYVITYTERNVVGAFADTAADEFYRDVNGTGFGQPFGTVRARLHLGADLAGALTGESACYRGALESTDRCTIDTSAGDDAGVVMTVSEKGLGAGETVTIAVGFAAGTFVQGEKTQPVPREPSADTPAPWWSIVLSVLASLAAIGVGAAAVVARMRRGNGAQGRGTIIPQYSVPKDLNVMVAAHLVERGRTAVAAQLVSLAVRRNLRIIDHPATESGADYALQYLNAEGTDELEAQLLHAIFGPYPLPDDVHELTKSEASLGTRVNAVSAAAASAVTGSGLRVARATSGSRWAVLAFLIGGVAVANQFGTIAAYSLAPWPLVAIVLATIAFVLSLVLVQRKDHLTPLGAETRDYLLGMRDYLTLAEQERFRMLQSPDGAERVDSGDSTQVVDLYEKLLPFAVIWGVEKEWAKELETRAAETEGGPDWFVSGNAFSAVALTSALHATSGAVTYTASSGSSSSFSSGFGGSGGGGFAGGGGGGGGGGGR
jgi:uncharacterized membrane protein YgcG